jgi:hypothetical protein
MWLRLSWSGLAKAFSLWRQLTVTTTTPLRAADSPHRPRMYELRLLLKILAGLGAASIVIFPLLVAAIVIVARLPPSPDTDLGSDLAASIDDRRGIPLQSIGEGDWIRACLVPPHLWSEVEWQTNVRRPDWSEDRNVVTLLLLGEHGRTLLVPFDRKEGDIAPVTRPCIQISQFTRLLGDAGMWPLPVFLRIK